MLLVEQVLGHCDDPEWQSRLASAQVDILELDQWEAQKNRLRKPTRAGVEVALALPRQSALRDGDILHFDADQRHLIRVSIALQDVLVIDLRPLQGLEFEALAQFCFELGHALGNQHWPAVVVEQRIYVPLTVDHKVMASVMRTHRFEHIQYEFVPGAAVLGVLSEGQARRLFGGANATPHQHLPGQQSWQPHAGSNPAPLQPGMTAPHRHV